MRIPSIATGLINKMDSKLGSKQSSIIDPETQSTISSSELLPVSLTYLFLLF